MAIPMGVGSLNHKDLFEFIQKPNSLLLLLMA